MINRSTLLLRPIVLPTAAQAASAQSDATLELPPDKLREDLT
jgi:hypothetical protein